MSKKIVCIAAARDKQNAADQQAMDDIVSDFAGMRPVYDRFCYTCDSYVRIDDQHCSDHRMRVLTPLQQQAAVSGMLADLGC